MDGDKAVRQITIKIINALRDECHETAKEKGWWDKERSPGELIALMHSELSEALEWLRWGQGKYMGNKSDHISPYLGIEEEFADVIIRIFDFCGHHKLRIGEALLAKMEYNKTRSYRHGGKAM
jgi:NTP pyrophosphatase (non-canonical NTP hydrolase)